MTAGGRKKAMADRRDSRSMGEFNPEKGYKLQVERNFFHSLILLSLGRLYCNPSLVPAGSRDYEAGCLCTGGDHCIPGAAAYQDGGNDPQHGILGYL